MQSGLGRGFVKHRPHSWHWTTTNQRPVPPGAESGASTSADQLRLMHNRQLGSSHSIARPGERDGTARSRGKKLIRPIPFSVASRFAIVGRTILIARKLVNCGPPARGDAIDLRRRTGMTFANSARATRFPWNHTALESVKTV